MASAATTLASSARSGRHSIAPVQQQQHQVNCSRRQSQYQLDCSRRKSQHKLHGQRRTKKRIQQHCLANRIILNISGEIFETFVNTLRRYPHTVLGRLTKERIHYCPISGQYFLPRNRLCFGAILFFYQSNGMLLCPPDIPMEIFVEECLFFQLPIEKIDAMKQKEGLLLEDAPKDLQSTASVKHYLWTIVDEPRSSTLAWIYTRFMLAATVASVSIACLSTTDEHSAHQPIYTKLDLITNIILFADTFLRILFAPNRYWFAKDPLSWIDASAMIAYFYTLFASPPHKSFLHKTLLFVRVLRVFTLYRLVKYWRRIHVAGQIIWREILSELKLFLLTFTLTVLFYSCVILMIECRGDSFPSIEQAAWWSMQSITTVGYGDVLPVTIPGKIFAGVFTAFGTHLILLPVMKIANKFQTMYDKNT